MFRMKDDEAHFDSALLDYIKNGSITVLQLFLQNKNPNIADYQGKTLLHYAAQSNNVSMTQYFIDNKYNIDCKDDYGDTPLILAIRNGSVDTVKLLIEAGADIYIERFRDKGILSGRSKADHSSMYSYINLITSVLEKVRKDCGTDEQLLISRLKKIGCSLIHAIELRDAKLTRLMLENGYSVHERDPKVNEIALHRAVEMGDYENVKVLMEYGSDVRAEKRKGLSPICLLNFESLEETDQKVEILKLLMEHGGSKTVGLVKRRKEAVAVLEKIVAYHESENYHDILSKIVEYLSIDDLKNVCEVSIF